MRHGAGQGDVARLVDVGGGLDVFLDCRGSGTPTVVLHSGFPNSADIWVDTESGSAPVAAELATFIRVCA